MDRTRRTVRNRCGKRVAAIARVAGIAGILTLGSVATPVAAGTVVLTPLRDNTLYQNAKGALSNGAGSYLYAGATAGWALRRAVVVFDVAGSVPAGAEVVSARLELRMSRTIAGAYSVELHRLSADWGEGTSDAEGGEGDGGVATLGDATWIHTFWATTAWAAAGGDFAATASATQSIDDIGTYSWGSTAALVSDVQDWLDAPAGNFGWILVGDESTPATAKRFNSRENGDTSSVPKLEIVYLLPIFTDGFESGDTAAWSLVEPPES